MENEKVSFWVTGKHYFQKAREKHLKVYIALIGLAVVLAGISFIYHQIVFRTEISEFELSATITDSAGVDPGSHFILKTTAELSPQVIEKYITTNPSFELSVKKVEALENTFEIIPTEPLAIDTVYNLQLSKGPLAVRDFSWAYQVRAPFQVTSSIPGDKGTDVPLNSGIEIYFNREIIINPEKFIEITPEVSGKFEVMENGIRFIPQRQLLDRTVYTLRIKPGLQTKDGETVLSEEKVIQFETGAITTTKNQSQVYFARKFTEFTPGAPIVFGVNAYNTSQVVTTVYRFESAEEFIQTIKKSNGNAPWARYHDNVTASFPENKKVFSGTLPVETRDYISSLRIPEQMTPGYYGIVVSSIDGKAGKEISWFQVNPAATFTALASVKSLIWLKDIQSESNLSGVPVEFNGKQVGITGADGVALFNTPPELLVEDSNESYYNAEKRFFVAKTSTLPIVIPVENEYGYFTSLSKSDEWWDYISFNKSVYLPTDTIRFWTIQKPRSGKMEGGEVTVTLTTPYWNSEQKNITEYGSVKVLPTLYNAITGEISFANLKPGTYELSFKRGDEIIAKQMVSVSAYLKPAYKITATPNKNVIFAGDTVTFKVQAEFFDGTRVGNTSFTYVTYGVSGKESEGSVTLNKDGEGSVTVTPTYSTNADYYWPSYLQFNVRPVKAEEGQIEVTSSVLVFGPHVDTSITKKQSGTNVDFLITTKAINLQSASQGEPYWDIEKYLGSVVPSSVTDVAVSEVLYLKNQTGTGYDPINKVSYPIYNYTTEYRPLSSEKVVADQNGTANFSFLAEKQKTYRVTFGTIDSFGRVAKDIQYVYGGVTDRDESSSDTIYYLNNADGTKEYKIGEVVNLSLQSPYGAVPEDKTKGYIFLTVANGSISYKQADTPNFSATFQERDIPNVAVWPGWFASGRFHNGYLQNISFDANERRLQVKITKDKDAYKPGDTVRLEINVRDKNNKPVQAEVNLSALDEAVFSIRPEEKDISNDLYRDIFAQLIIRTSNMPPYGGGGAEKGGGGDDAARSNLQEMAIFKSVTTDSNGYARLEFTLPDNITSWRLTSQAVTEDLFVGKSVDFIPVTLPLFVDGTLNATYLTGDELTLRLRAFGEAFNQREANYTVTSPTLPFKKLASAGSAGLDVALGKLTLGDHKLTLEVKSGGLTDAVTRPLAVVDTYFTKKSGDVYEGVSGLTITNKATGYTGITFTTSKRGQIYNLLQQFSCGCGVRLDQKGARVIAEDLLVTYFGSTKSDEIFDSAKYQAYSGGIQLLPYSSEDLELSALSAHLFDGEVFDKAILKAYFNRQISSNKQDVSKTVTALYGLSAFRDPVLTKLQTIKDTARLTVKDRLYIALALDSLGAKEEARKYYKETIRKDIEIQSSYAYIGGLKNDATIIATALALALTASLQEEDAALYAVYLEENRPKETLDTFERLLFIKYALPRLPKEEASFTYQVGSQTTTKTLQDGESLELNLSADELPTFKLLTVKGGISVVTSYEEQTPPNTVIKDKNLSLKRSYEVDGGVTKEFKDGDIVLVRLQPTFASNSLDGAYQIVDYLPSGLRVADQESTRYSGKYDNRVFPVEIDNQKVTFIVDKSLNLPVYYYARVVSKGKYKAEPAILQSLRSEGSITITNEDSVLIK